MKDANTNAMMKEWPATTGEGEKPAKPGLFESFSDMLAHIPDTALDRTLKRESYMLGVDLAEHRPLPPVEAGSILAFSNFVSACRGKGQFFSPVTLPPAHVAFYRQIVNRLIAARELLPATRDQFERIFHAA